MELKQNNTTTFLKRSFQRIFLHYGHTREYIEYEGQQAADIIRDALVSKKPAMICRYGSNELQCVVAYIRELKYLKDYKMYQAFHWNDLLFKMTNFAGFFPNDRVFLRKFCELILEDTKLIDILGSWRKEEYYLRSRTSHVRKIRLRDIEPFLHASPWSKILEGKKVLVIHPFEETIRSQYQKRALLFENKDILPAFDLKTIKAVQSIAGTETEFKTWFDALDHMKRQIDVCDFDIALIGCGAYGFPLAAHVKRKGKKAVHIGGALQLLFGIMGKRWEQKENIMQLKNQHWVYPAKIEAPKNKDIVEGGCYW